MTPSNQIVAAHLRLREYVASSVKEYREKRKLSIPQMAARIGINPDRLSKIEKQSCELKLLDLMKLSAAIEVQTSQLLRIVGL
jgi:transcriptional regulator with XRE-family HTH domain